MRLLSHGILTGGSHRSKILRLVLWAASMVGLLFGMFGPGHRLRVTSLAAASICSVGCYLEYLRVKPRDKGDLIVLDLKERAQ